MTTTAASIRALDKDEIWYANQAYQKMMHHAPSIREAMLKTNTDTEHQGMIFYEYIEQQFKNTNQPTFAFELYDGMYVSTARFLIQYNESPAILTLINESKILPENLDNDLYTTPIAQYLNDDVTSFDTNFNIIERNELIKTFVSNYEGFAFIRDLEEDENYYANAPYISFTRQAESLAELKESIDDDFVSEGLSYCEYVEAVFKQNLQSTLAFEIVGDSAYISLRVLIEYSGSPVMLTLISECYKSMKHYHHSIYQCDVNSLMKAKSLSLVTSTC